MKPHLESTSSVFKVAISIWKAETTGFEFGDLDILVIPTKY